MGFQNVLIGMAWENGQYQVTFQKTISAPKIQETTFQEVEIIPGYLDQFAVLNRKHVEDLLTKPEDLKVLSENGQTCSFFLLHRVGL